MNGREIIILQNGEDVLASYQDCIRMELEENITLGVVSSFNKTVFENSKNLDAAGNIVSILGSLLGKEKWATTTFKNSIMSARVWDGSEPISLSFSVTFHVGVKDRYDPKRQVYEPMIALSKLPLPWIEDKQLKAPGTVTGDIVKTALMDLVGGAEVDTTKIVSTVFSIGIGDIVYLPWVVISRAEPTFSKQMAKASDGKFYPIHGTMNLDVSTIKMGSRDMLDIPAADANNYRNEYMSSRKRMT